MNHPGVSAYTSGTCSTGNVYFIRLMRRFKREGVSLQGLIEDISGVKMPKIEAKPVVERPKKPVDLSRLKHKYSVREL